MYDKKHSFQIGLLILTAICGIFFISSNSIADVKTKAENLLSKIKQYEFGQSRESLTEFAELIRNAIDSRQDKQILEKTMLGLLNSGATFAGKQFICKELSIIGTEKAVPTLEPMLTNKNTSDIARYALERIPGKKVDDVLRISLNKTKGTVRIGIINTIGERRDNKAVEVLGKFMFKSDNTTAIAAAAALGKIADDASIEILTKAKEKTKGAVKATVLDSYLKCADKLAMNGETERASTIYKELFDQNYELPIRSAALRGLINTNSTKSGEIILKILKTENEKVKTTAISLIRELPPSQSMQNIAAELPKLEVIEKIQLLSSLQDRKDISVHDDIVKAAKNKDVNVRIAAYKALTSLGDERDVSLLAKAAAKGEFAEKKVAKESLALLNGQKVNETILSSIKKAEPALQVELIESIGDRNISTAVPMLLKTTASVNSKVRSASIKALELVASPENLNELVDILINVQSNVERRRAEKTVVAVAHKIETEDEQATVVLKKLATVKDVENRSSLLRVLGKIGDNNGLPVLKNALKDKNENIQKAGIQALSDWPSPEPLKDLLKVAESSTNEVNQVLALRGYIRLIGLLTESTDDQIIQQYNRAMKLAKQVNEKRMVLSGISNIRTMNALSIAEFYLNNPELKNEAEVAVVEIARHTRGNFPQETKAVLLKIIDSQNSEVSNDARRYLKEIDK
jgi:HEAT repeat protein